MNLASHFSRELKLLGMDSNDNLVKTLIRIGKIIDLQHLSYEDIYKSSILLNTLIKHEPLTPLTGNEDEWFTSDEKYDINLRCPRVFREKTTGNCFDIHGKLFLKIDGNNQYYSSNTDSHVDITFPYVPKSEIC